MLTDPEIATDTPQTPTEQPVSDFVKGDAYRKLPRDARTWIIKSVLPVGGLLNLYGLPKEGKSFAALQLAAAVANPDVDEWLSLPVVSHGQVCYLQVDTPRSVWADRLDSCTAAGLDLSRVWFADTEQAPYPFNILNPEHANWLETQCMRVGLNSYGDLIIIDVIREVHDGDENDSGVMKQVVNRLVQVTRPAAICFVSHARKPNMAMPGKVRDDLTGDNRGSGYVAGRMDCIMKITPKRLTFKGRAIDKTSIPMHQGDAGLWVVDNLDTGHALKQVVEDKALKSLRAKARRLAELTGKTEEACRSLIRCELGVH